MGEKQIVLLCYNDSRIWIGLIFVLVYIKWNFLAKKFLDMIIGCYKQTYVVISPWKDTW